MGLVPPGDDDAWDDPMETSSEMGPWWVGVVLALVIGSLLVWVFAWM
jgi:hypothetical protein